MAGFNPERLGQALAARRQSQSQLASLVGVSATTVSKWRNGVQAPEAETLDRLSAVLNVASEWFTRPTGPALSEPLFRSNASAHAQARWMLEARLQWVHEIAHALAEFVEFPALNIPSRDYTDPEEIAQKDIEDAANEARDAWRLGRGPIQDLALAAEGAGVVLVREETGTAQIEGLSSWGDALARPIILLSADKDNAYRSRFDLAHELGHLVLHRHIKNPGSKERHKLLERQAHAFAGALLMPADTFPADVRRIPGLDDLLVLKRRWGASVGAQIMRLHALDLIDDYEKLVLFKRKSARWGAKEEPGDTDRAAEQPRMLSRTVQLLVEQNVMPRAAVTRHFGLSTFDLEQLTGLPHGFLSGQGDVVDLATLRATRATPTREVISTRSTVLPFKSSR